MFYLLSSKDPMRQVETGHGQLYVSGCPEVEDLFNFKPFDIIWNLAEELDDFGDLERYFTKNLLMARIPDFDIPTDEYEFMDQLDQVINCLYDNGKVLVHCNGGHGRTGMTLALIKNYVDNVKIKKALKFARRICKGPEDKEQVAFARLLSKTRMVV